MIDPKIGETVYDPAAGTAGFLVAAYNHIRLANSSPRGIDEVEIDGKTQRRGLGDKLSAAQMATLQNRDLLRQRRRSEDGPPRHDEPDAARPAERAHPAAQRADHDARSPSGRPSSACRSTAIDVVLANPPFSGRVDKDRIVDDVKVGTTTATELLFLKYMMDSLRPGGRCGVIVPEGVLFGSTGAHKELRRQLIENNRVEAVLSPAGRRVPALFGREDLGAVLPQGRHDRARAVPARRQRRLQARRQPRHADRGRRSAGAGRRPTCRASRDGTEWAARDPKAEWTEKWWFADAATLRANDFNLSAGRYRPMSQAQVEHRDPRELLDELAAIEAEIAEEVEALRACAWRGAA